MAEFAKDNNVPVKTDYIDREAFVAKERERFCANCDRRKGMKNGKLKFVYEIGDAPCRACWVDDMITEAEDFPAADVRPVVRGEWVHHFIRPNVFADSFWHCTVCGYRNGEHWANVYHHFCPNCGADMRGREDGTDES